MKKSTKKEKTIKGSQTHEKDTGSADVQISLLSENIQDMLSHLKKHPKDTHSRRGLLKMVIKRKKLLKYLERTDQDRYKKVLKQTGLKK